jgi:hypothetical protein
MGLRSSKNPPNIRPSLHDAAPKRKRRRGGQGGGEVRVVRVSSRLGGKKSEGCREEVSSELNEKISSASC